ncbi:MAG TPA: FAD-dependent oxidoreductase, partial [Thermoproteales archaeon]|nr:FAD-dependent oxidoreductase [Thermoproteales archaeon]
MVEVLVKVAVIGGGITGAAIAYDLALRGFKVTLFERGSIASGTSGRTHGLLHSGCRYVRDVEVARRCYIENMILRKIAPWLFEKNGGLFIGITEEDLAYKDFFLSQCEKAGIPVREISVKEAFKLEPNLNPNTKTTVIVPDSSFEALRVVLSFLASAKKRGAEVRPFHEVIGFNIRSGEITSIKVKDWVTLKEKEFKVDFVVNATGPWAAKVSSLAGVKVPVKPSPVVMVALRERVSTMVIN